MFEQMGIPIRLPVGELTTPPLAAVLQNQSEKQYIQHDEESQMYTRRYTGGTIYTGK